MSRALWFFGAAALRGNPGVTQLTRGQVALAREFLRRRAEVGKCQSRKSDWRRWPNGLRMKLVTIGVNPIVTKSSNRTCVRFEEWYLPRDPEEAGAQANIAETLISAVFIPNDVLGI